jgi:hypothetical protein
MLSLTVTVSAEGSSLTAPVNNPNPRPNPVPERGPARPAVQANNDPTRPTSTIIPPYKIRDVPVEDCTLVRLAPDKEDLSRDVLNRADRAINKINTIKTWKSAVNIMKWVMDTVRPVAAVCQCRFCPSCTGLTSILQLNPQAHLAWSILSKIPEVCLYPISEYTEHRPFCLTCCQTLLQQVQRDENIEILLETIHDVFEFAEEADMLRNIKPESKQSTILEEMLECVSECAIFIRSYAEDVQIGMSP